MILSTKLLFFALVNSLALTQCIDSNLGNASAGIELLLMQGPESFMVADKGKKTPGSPKRGAGKTGDDKKTGEVM